MSKTIELSDEQVKIITWALGNAQQEADGNAPDWGTSRKQDECIAETLKLLQGDEAESEDS